MLFYRLLQTFRILEKKTFFFSKLISEDGFIELTQNPGPGPPVTPMGQHSTLV